MALCYLIHFCEVCLLFLKNPGRMSDLQVSVKDPVVLWFVAMQQCDSSLSSKLPHASTLTFYSYLCSSHYLIDLPTHTCLYCNVPPCLCISCLFLLTSVLPCLHIPGFLPLTPPNSSYRCSCQQSCLQQNPAAAKYIKETKASTIA